MNKLRNWILRFFSWLAWIIGLAQLALFWYFYNPNGLPLLRYAGYFLWAVSAVLGWLPMYELKKMGGVPKGKSYVYTTKLVESGIYSIVRHPQFLGWMAWGIALMCISQHHIIIVMGIVVIFSTYLSFIDADIGGIEKFGEDYRRYMRKVPRMNFVAGIVRAIKRKGQNKSLGKA